MVLSLVRISACRAAVLALASCRSFSREAILAGSASRASSFSVTVSRMDNLAMIASYFWRACRRRWRPRWSSSAPWRWLLFRCDVAARGRGRLCCCGKMGEGGWGEEGEVGRGRWEKGGEGGEGEMVVVVCGGGWVSRAVEGKGYVAGEPSRCNHMTLLHILVTAQEQKQGDVPCSVAATEVQAPYKKTGGLVILCTVISSPNKS
jgi:hypothetical protein